MTPYTPQDLDYLTRTVLAEAGPNASPLSMAAVASVAKNRLASGQYGKSITDIVTAPHQFEPWSYAGQPGKNDPLRFDANSRQYQEAEGVVQAVLAGGPDPTFGATHFVSPAGQKADGRTMPQWANGTPLTSIGGQDFYAPQGAVKGTSMYPTPQPMQMPGVNPGQATSPLMAMFNAMMNHGGAAQGQGSSGGTDPATGSSGIPGYTPNFLGQLLFGQQGLRGAEQSALAKMHMPNGLLGSMFGLGPQPQQSTTPGIPTGTPAAVGTPNLPQPAPGGAPGGAPVSPGLPQLAAAGGAQGGQLPGMGPQGLPIPQAPPQGIAMPGAGGLPMGSNTGFVPPMAGGGMTMPPGLLASIFGGA